MPARNYKSVGETVTYTTLIRGGIQSSIEDRENLRGGGFRVWSCHSPFLDRASGTSPRWRLRDQVDRPILGHPRIYSYLLNAVHTTRHLCASRAAYIREAFSEELATHHLSSKDLAAEGSLAFLNR